MAGSAGAAPKQDHRKCQAGVATWKGQPAGCSLCWPVGLPHCYRLSRTFKVSSHHLFICYWKLPRQVLSKEKQSHKSMRICNFRLRRIDAVASVLWFFILCLYLAESYLTGVLGWMDTAKLTSISLCCLVSFAAAVPTRKP